MLRSFEGDKTKLGKAEQFFLDLLQLPKWDTSFPSTHYYSITCSHRAQIVPYPSLLCETSAFVSCCYKIFACRSLNRDSSVVVVVFESDSSFLSCLWFLHQHPLIYLSLCRLAAAPSSFTRANNNNITLTASLPNPPQGRPLLMKTSAGGMLWMTSTCEHLLAAESRMSWYDWRLW